VQRTRAEEVVENPQINKKGWNREAIAWNAMPGIACLEPCVITP
jgi:hypothetical protein